MGAALGDHVADGRASALRSCGPSALLVGGEHRLPADPCEYNGEYGIGPGCNNLRCQACGARVRHGAAGVRLRDDRPPGSVATLYATEDWTSLPFIAAGSSRWRLYACACRWWEEASEHLLDNDRESPGDPDLPWSCGGHPPPTLPVTLGDLVISTETDWPAIVERIFAGACPRRLERDDQGPAVWLSWLHGYLAGLPVARALARAVGDRIDDRDERVVGAVLLFYRRFPAAEGFDRVVSRAEADLGAVLSTWTVPEHAYRPRPWDVMIAALMQRTDVDDPLRARVVDLVREVMLLPAGERDPVKATLGQSWHAEAFGDDDLAWMTEHVVALDAAGPGRWSKIMSLLLAAARRDRELDHLIVLAGSALLRSGRVSPAELRGWIDARGYQWERWVLALERSLAEAP